MKALSLALALAIGLQGAALAAPPGQKTFDSLDDAVNALVGAFRAGDRKALLEILGPKGGPVISSGDNVADQAAYKRFVAAYDRAHRLQGGGGRSSRSVAPLYWLRSGSASRRGRPCIRRRNVFSRSHRSSLGAP